MAQGPEARFWSSVRASKPTKVFATRIENRAGGGIPDVHCVWDGLPFWIELKASAFDRVKLSPHQIAWHTSYHSRGGLSFFLVSTPVRGSSALISGSLVTQLAEMSLSEVPGPRFLDLRSMWEGVGVAVRTHYSGLLSPAAEST